MTCQRILKNGLLLTLRHADPHDAERLLLYNERIAGESENITFGPGEFGMTLEEERTYLEQLATAQNRLFLVGEVEGEIVGTLTFNGGTRPRVRHAGMFGISIVRAYWNQGVASHLLAYLISWAQQTGIIRKINLHVRVDNLAAIHLYEKYGFVREGWISREMFLHGQFIDVYVMGLEIDPPQVAPMKD